MYEYYFAILFFVVASTVTPGPNNIMILTSGVNFGVKKSLPHLAGICLGFPVMVIAIGLGLGAVFTFFPQLHLIIKVLGTGYLFYLAWLTANAASKLEAKNRAKPLTFTQAALFQWLNPKAWVMATGAIAAFTSTDLSMLTQISLIALSYFVAGSPCVVLWLVFGVGLRQWLADPEKRKWFNWIMAALLVLSILPVIQEIIMDLQL